MVAGRWLKARLGARDCRRTFLARELCEREDWRNAKGELCLGRASKVLRRTRSASAGGSSDERSDPGVLGPVAGLSRQAPVVPSRRSWRGSGCRRGQVAGAVDDGIAPSRRGLSRASATGFSRPCTASSAAWRCVMASQGAGPPHRLAARDANIGRVVNNDRFLPGVRGLASVSLFHGRVANDREERYGVRLTYSYVGATTWVRSLPCGGVLQGVAGVREAAVGGLVSRAGRVIGSGPRRGRMAEYGRSAHSALSRWARSGSVVRVRR